MRTLLPFLPPLAAGALLTLSYPALPVEPSEGVEEQPAIEAPKAPPARKPAPRDPRIITAPLHDASSGASAPPADADPATDETDAERAKRVLEKFKERPGYQEDPPEPQA